MCRYCECFASGVYCDGCNCNNCCNNVENEAARRDAVEATLERNPNAFRPKIASSPHGIRDRRVCFFHALIFTFLLDDLSVPQTQQSGYWKLRIFLSNHQESIYTFCLKH